MAALETYNALIATAGNDMVIAREFIESRINVCDLAQVKGYAEFDERHDLAFEIFDVMNP